MPGKSLFPVFYFSLSFPPFLLFFSSQKSTKKKKGKWYIPFPFFLSLPFLLSPFLSLSTPFWLSLARRGRESIDYKRSSPAGCRKEPWEGFVLGRLVSFFFFWGFLGEVFFGFFEGNFLGRFFRVFREGNFKGRGGCFVSGGAKPFFPRT